MSRPQPRPGKPLDPELPPRARELTQALRDLRTAAGQPSYRTLCARSAERAGAALTLATLSRLFGPQPRAADQSSLPEWVYYDAVITLLGADPQRYRAQWDDAQQEWRSRDTPPAAPTASTRPPRRSRRRTRIGVAIGGVLAALITAAVVQMTTPPAGPPTPPAQPVAGRAGPQLDRTDPNNSGCAAIGTLQTFYTHLYTDWQHQLGLSSATVTLHYSPVCRSVWATVTGAVPGTVATLHRDSDAVELTCAAGPDGSCATPQLNDADTTSHAFARAPGVYGRTRSV